MAKLVQDIRIAIRMLGKSPGFTVTAVLTLALGVGANTAIFSVVDSFLFRPLPVANPGQLTVVAFEQTKGRLEDEFSYADYKDIQNQTKTIFSDITAYILNLDGLSINGRAERVLTNYVSGNFFEALGIKPYLGRFILPSEGKSLGADPEIVLDYSYWRQYFGADRQIIGKRVLMNGHPVTVIGVAPESFHGVYSMVNNTQAYLPLSMIEHTNYYSPDLYSNRSLRNFLLLARLRPGVSLEQAQAKLNVIARRLASQYPDSDKALVLRAFPELRSRPDPNVAGQLSTISTLFLSLAGLVLVLACVNVANILLVRATVRRREIAIRSALGASRGQIIGQLMTESLILAIGAGAVGLLIGAWASSILSTLNLHTDIPIRPNFTMDGRVFAYGFAAAIFTAVVMGIMPAVRASRTDLNVILREGGRSLSSRRERVRSLLVMGQVAASLTLLIMAGLFTRTLQKAQESKLGFDPHNVLNLSLDPTEVGYNAQQGREFYKQLLTHVRGLPGVESASVAFSTPMGYYYNDSTPLVPGYQPPPGQPLPVVDQNSVSPGYFDTLRMKVLRGRDFSNADGEHAPFVAIINQSMANKYWPGQNPLGRVFSTADDPKHHLEVIGVVSDIKTNAFGDLHKPCFYQPIAQVYVSLETLQVRARANPVALAPEIRKQIQMLAPGLPVFSVQTMTQALYTTNGFLIFEFGALLAASLGLLGLILAAVGVYGVVSYSAAQRTHEIGIRIALGALPSEILRVVFRQGFVIVLAGMVIGLLGAVAIAHAAAAFLIVSPTDPITYTSVLALLGSIACFACFIPAWRAMRIDPVIVLRQE